MRIHLTWLLLILTITASAQRNSTPLGFASYGTTMQVAADGSISVVTRAGEFAATDSAAATWFKRPPKGDQDDLSGPTLDNTIFFNRDTGFVAGFIFTDESTNDVIYHTTDGGRHWKEVNFGQSGWVDHAVYLPNGEAWMSVSGSGIAYTRDFGFSWTKLKKPADKERYTAIFFNKAHHGLAGSLWNVLNYTSNNCKTWRQLPTPLDQKKYRKTNAESRPAFERVAIFGDYFLVKQEDMVFYTRRDSINWVWLERIDDFFTDAENTALFLREGSTIYSSNAALEKLRTFKMYDGVFALCCANKKLYQLSSDSLHIFQDGTADMVFPLVLHNREDIEPEYIGFTGTGEWGLAGKELLVKRMGEKVWTTKATLPLPEGASGLRMLGNGVLLCRAPTDSILYLDTLGTIRKRTTRNELIQSFLQSDIKQLVFEKGTRGCFHFAQSDVTYTLNGNVFSGPVEKTSELAMPQALPEIASELVRSFTRQLPEILNPDYQVTVADLAFTPADYARCAKDIRNFEKKVSQPAKAKAKAEDSDSGFYFYRNNIAFDRLFALVDSIPSLSPERLYPILLNLEHGWSTTTNWDAFSLVNAEGKIMRIEQLSYSNSSTALVWRISIDGYSQVTFHPAVYRFLAAAYPAFTGERSRVSVLHEIVRQLY